MKTTLIALTLALTGCAVSSPNGGKFITAPGHAISLEQMESIRTNTEQCDDLAEHVAMIDEQIKLKGFTNVNPENLNSEDQRYNRAAHIVKWSLIIGCNNPHRYEK
jgi:uncharacterized membrane protein affecting hemolysin expression